VRLKILEPMMAEPKGDMNETVLALKKRVRQRFEEALEEAGHFDQIPAN